MLGFLVGNKESYNLENKIYDSVSLFGAVAGIAAIIWYSKPGFSLIPDAAVLVAVAAYCVLYCLSRFKKIYNAVILFFTTLGFLSVLWILNEGLMGSIPILYIASIAIFIAVSKPKYHLLFLTITILNFAVLIFLDNQYDDALSLPNPNIVLKESNLILAYIAAIIIVYLITRYIKNTLEKENKEIINQKLELQRLNCSKDLFFNIIAHDLRMPFTGILGVTDIMCDKTNKLTLKEMQEFALLIHKSSVKAFELLESLLEWGRIQHGKIDMNPQRLNLKNITANSVNYFKEEYSNKEIKISNLVPAAIDICTDVHILKTIQRNLIHNAIKFTPNGGEILISIEDDHDGKVVMVIQDSGIGMNEKMVQHLFNIGSNTNRLGTNGESSTGLGLIICKKLVEKLGGELTVESTLNAGSKFKFDLQKNHMPQNISNLISSDIK
ncbi:Signal transduction histidine kinase [Saccharicrinis carchari]|uniref:histidine kinase n=1 Tax=Saccharicrinis carchari TaxID=1168039 RepID=A0A521AT24_SACCC|nr:HAMP domain-containing sensor histidine kinase [Saccharicrinis carchari]SMO37871.1 Signal transduction histidine kinase [Saccharicrinis carchari]